MKEPLYQVNAINTKTGLLEPVPWFPKMEQRAVDQFVTAMCKAIIAGKEKRYTDPKAILCL